MEKPGNVHLSFFFQLRTPKLYVAIILCQRTVIRKNIIMLIEKLEKKCFTSVMTVADVLTL